MAFKDRLKEARLNRGLTQEQIAEKIGVAKSTFTGYEKGNSEPSMYTISQIMNVLKVDANFLWQDEMDALGGNPMQVKYPEMKLIEKYRSLDPYGQETVNIVLDRELARSKQLQDAKSPAAVRIYTYMHKIACAGSGFYFDDIPTDTMEAPYCEGADFIIGVSGDSMEPDYHDGENLYVKKVDTLNYGDVGIFTIGNECFLKEYGEDGLISRNKQRKDIPGSEDVRLIGKVIEKVK